MSIIINQERLNAYIADFNEARNGDLSEAGDVSWFIHGLLDSAGPFEFPQEAQAVAYDLDGEDPGFLFALRPRSLAPDRLEFDVNVTGFFTAINNLVGSWEDPLPIRELVESVRLEFEALLPAYNRLFGE
jgi:hypothetical protein